MSNLPDTFDHELSEGLRRIGLAKREILATWEGVPSPIKAAIPREVAATMADGHIPACGFGLGADIGAGKTSALAALVKGCVKKAYMRAYEACMGNLDSLAFTNGWVPSPEPIMWISWPDFVSFIRANATKAISEERVRHACRVELLVLDDLGRERTKGNYLEDWATDQLQRIITERSREMLPIMWTTNVRAASMVDLYGGATVDRLFQDNPMCWIPGMKSLRLEANR